jgi:ATP-binding cassette subfamily F protein 3
LLASAKSLLVLDEPTNHLDIPSAERLEEALAMPEDEDEAPNYDGTMILISHDRALIDATCENLIILDGKGGAKIHHGTYTDWHEEEVARAKQKNQAESQAKEKREAEERRQREAKQAKEAAKKQTSGAVGALAKLRMDELEKRIGKCETRLREIDAQLANPDTWSNASKSAKLSEERAKVAAELEPYEFEWARRAEEA